MISFLRKGKNVDDTLLVVANFTPVVRNDYRIGVPFHGEWKEIFNSDAMEFGGSGVGNGGSVWSEELPWDYQNASIKLSIPPLGVMVFKLAK